MSPKSLRKILCINMSHSTNCSRGNPHTPPPGNKGQIYQTPFACQVPYFAIFTLTHLILITLECVIPMLLEVGLLSHSPLLELKPSMDWFQVLFSSLYIKL